MRYTFPARIELRGDRALAGLFISNARALLGGLMQDLAEAKIRSGRVEKRITDDVVIRAEYDGTLARITITARERGGYKPPTTFEVWVPRGIVVYPASDAAPRGWGLPVQLDTTGGATQFDAINRAPGLDVARWTPGGALGQVLLTDAEDAAYPQRSAIVVPALYTNDYGPKLTKPYEAAPTASWRAFRLEFADFAANSPGAGVAESAAIVSNKRAVFTLVNELRDSLSLDPLQLPLRGYYDGGQLYTEIMFETNVLGHFAAQFPATYQTYPERTEKEGFLYPVFHADADSHNKPSGGGAENGMANAASATVIGADPNGYSIYAIVPGANVDAAAAYAAWLASPPHYANMTSTSFNDFFTTTNIGFRGAYAGQQFELRSQWLSAGNRQWISAHDDVPVISWFGFLTQNLAWETWPVAFDNSDDASPPTDPLIVLGPFVDVNGRVWLRYRYGNTTPSAVEKTNDYVLALDSRIFARGRAIAVAPHGGLVWAAAVQKYESPDADTATVYRLIALVHHADDNGGDGLTDGMTRYLRVWWCDLPNDGMLPCTPHSQIRGVYGDEDEGWPWDVVDSPYSWRGGDLVDVGTTGTGPDLLKYASQWTFNALGTKASCLRDYGPLASYADLWVPSATSSYNIAFGLLPRWLELSLVGNAFNPLVASLTVHAAPAGTALQDYDVGDPSGPWTLFAYPLAVGYDAGDAVSFCFNVLLVNTASTPAVNTSNVYYASFRFDGDYDFVPSSVSDGTLYSCAVSRADLGRIAYCDNPSVLDVRDRVVVATGAIQFSQEAPGDIPSLNPEFEPCWVGTSSPVSKIRVWRDGELLLQDATLANPDGVVYAWTALCYTYTTFASHYWIGTQLPLSQSPIVLPAYARTRDAWLLSYLAQPQAHVLLRVTAGSSDCAPYGGSDTICSPTPGSTFVELADDTAVCRGGWATSSFADTAALATMTQTVGANPRFLYARAI